jgi:hypothetical protein
MICATAAPVLEVRLIPVVPARRKRRKEPVSVAALIDTGASTTVLKESIAEALGMDAVAVTTVHTATSADVICGEYDVSLMLRPDMVFNVRALGLPMDGQSFGCLIGRDLLAQCAMIYLGLQNQFVLSL